MADGFAMLLLRYMSVARLAGRDLQVPLLLAHCVSDPDWVLRSRQRNCLIQMAVRLMRQDQTEHPGIVRCQSKERSCRCRHVALPIRYPLYLSDIPPDR